MTLPLSLRKSRIFKALQKEIASLGRRNLGGRGNINPTKVMRVPLNVFIELDDLIKDARDKTASSPSSPRNERLVAFLDKLEQILEE